MWIDSFDAFLRYFPSCIGLLRGHSYITSHSGRGWGKINMIKCDAKIQGVMNVVENQLPRTSNTKLSARGINWTLPSYFVALL